MLAQVVRSSSVSSILYSLAVFALGWALSSSARQEHHSNISTSKDSLFVLTVQSQKPNESGYRLEVLLHDSSAKKESPGAILYLRDSIESVLPGDSILYKGVFKEIEEPDLDYHFDRKSFYAQKNIFYQGFANAEDIFITGSKDFSPSRLRQVFIQDIRDKLDSLEFQKRDLEYLIAIGLGDKTQFDKELKKAYQHLGLIHILAVSGLHVGIVWMIIFSAIQRIPILNKIFLKYSISLIALWIYVVISGASPSVLRAALMLSIYALGKLLKRDAHILNVVFAAAFLLLVFDPSLLYDLGFQLSFLAVISICWLMPFFSSSLQGQNLFVKRITEMCLVSIIATLATGPISLSQFGLISNVFLISNLVFLPAVALELYSFMLLLLFSASDYFTSLMAKCLNIYLEHKHQLICLFASQDFVSSQVTIDDPVIVFLLYALFTLLAFILFRRNYRLIKYMLLLLLVLSNYSWKARSNYVFEMSKSGYQWLEFRKGEEITVIADTAKESNEYNKQQLLNSWSDIKVIAPSETYVDEELAFLRGTLIFSDSIVFTNDRLREAFYSVP